MNYGLCAFFSLVSGYGAKPTMLWAYFVRILIASATDSTFVIPSGAAHTAPRHTSTINAMTAEFYPTRLRATGSVFLYATALLGAIGGTWVSYYLGAYEISWAISIACAVAVTCVTFLPETACMPLEYLDDEEEVMEMPYFHSPFVMNALRDKAKKTGPKAAL
jgi:hypothetical protein